LASRTLSANLTALGLKDRAVILSRPVSSTLPQLLQHGPYTWVFADPPYAESDLLALLSLFGRVPLVSSDGVFIFESASRDADRLVGSVPLDTGFRLLDRRRYGDTSLLFFGPLGGKE
jgi:16S rRNA G966 N2-methylase RsmD